MNDIEFHNFSFSFQKNQKLFSNLNICIPKGFSLLIGPTGSGKSTLLRIIAGLYPKYAGMSSGNVDLHGKSCAMMFQNAGEQFTMATPREEIIFALENLQIERADYQKRLQQAVAFTKIAPLLDQKIVSMSDGEQQRVALAVLVAMDVDILLLDEPFASCDPVARQVLIDKLQELQQQGKTIILSDHVLTGYHKICNRVYEIKNHKLSLLSKESMSNLFRPKVITKRTFPLPDEEKKMNIFALRNTKISTNRLLLNEQKLYIPKGKTILLTGPNGVGKTSFFRALTKMIPYEGSMLFKNHEIAKLRSRKYLQQVGQIFQQATDQFLRVTVADEIALSKKKRNPFFTDEKIKQALKELKLTNHLNQVVYSLSGGQQKKLQILLMLMCKQKVLLLDEPLTGLDDSSVQVILHLLSESQKQLHQTFLIISHQIDRLAAFCDYHLVFDQKKLSYSKGVAYESKS